MHSTHKRRIHEALAASRDAGKLSDDQYYVTLAAFNAEPLDISTASFLRTLSACHHRIKEIQASGSNCHQMDEEIGNWDSVVKEELLPVLERIIYWEPSHDEMMSAFGTKWHDGL